MLGEEAQAAGRPFAETFNVPVLSRRRRADEESGHAAGRASMPS